MPADFLKGVRGVRSRRGKGCPGGFLKFFLFQNFDVRARVRVSVVGTFLVL